MYIKKFFAGITLVSSIFTYGQVNTTNKVIMEEVLDTVRGVVRDSKNEPLAGVSLVWQNTSHGTTTDINGNFKLYADSTSKYLVASYVGYASDTCNIAQLEENQQIEIVLLEKVHNLNTATITTRRSGVSRMSGVVNGVRINKEELFKAACCNLGESFTTNPSVDVNYSDAATGAKQIKLLGLSGIYVQTLTENLPAFRGAAVPYYLGYVPGNWMKAIQVSKGASSVKNGYEGITGQIDVEYLKPEDEQGASVNVYGNSEGRMEVNADANIHLKNKLNTEVLTHYENSFTELDHNRDGFLDKPNVKQVNIQNRWNWLGDNYVFHGGISLLNERRESGQTVETKSSEPFKIRTETNRYEGYMKHALILDKQRGTNIALMTSASMHQLNTMFGHKLYDVNEKNLYAQLMFETNFTTVHNLSAGLSFNHDYLGQSVRTVNDLESPIKQQNERETTPGIYAQYTLNLSNKLTAMAGVRADHSSIYGTFITPRFHAKYAPNDIVSLRISAGKGYRTAHALAENHYLLASGRNLVIDKLEQENAWNYGVSSSFYIPLFGNTLKLNAEYYYTRFGNQVIIDYDTNPKEIRITNLNGRSFSHTLQIDATYPILKRLEITAAYRLNDVRATYNGTLQEKPLTNKYKAMLAASYKTPLGKWQFDATLQLNGSGRMPSPYNKDDGTLSWESRYPAFEQLNAQITRWFRHFSIYIGGENLTGVSQTTPIISADKPWSPLFEPTLTWGPVSGAMVYAGIRINIGRTK